MSRKFRLLPSEQPPRIVTQITSDGGRAVRVTPHPCPWSTGFCEQVEAALTQFDDEGAPLQSLAISHTPIPASTINRIVLCLSPSPSDNNNINNINLCDLEVTHCELADISVPNLCSLIDSCPSLTTLRLNGNTFSQHGREILQKHIDAHPQLRHVYLETMPLRSEAINNRTRAHHLKDDVLGRKAQAWANELAAFHELQRLQDQHRRATRHVEAQEHAQREDISWEWESWCVDARHDHVELYFKLSSSGHNVGADDLCAKSMSMDYMLALIQTLSHQEGSAREVVSGEEYLARTSLVAWAAAGRLDAVELQSKRLHVRKLRAMESLEEQLRSEIRDKYIYILKDVTIKYSRETKRAFQKDASAVQKKEVMTRSDILTAESQERQFVRGQFKLFRDFLRRWLEDWYRETIQRKSLDDKIQRVIAKAMKKNKQGEMGTDRLEGQEQEPSSEVEDAESDSRAQIASDSLAELKLIYCGYLSSVVRLPFDVVNEKLD
eukprot:PhM_4_TR15626/c0_g1_i1/m.66336